MTRLGNNDKKYVGVMAVLTAFGLWVDLVTPLGYAPWIVYFIPAMTALFLRSPAIPPISSAISSVLVVIGFFLSPPGVDPKMTVFNRAMGIIGICVLGFIARAFIKTKLRLEERGWIESGQAEFAEKIHGQQDPRSLGRTILGFLVPYFNAQVGALYVISDDETTLRRAASYATGAEAQTAQASLKKGEGYVGQAALDKKILLLQDIPENSLSGVTSFGKIKPRHVIVVPLSSSMGTVEGVVELGFLKPVTDIQHKLLEAISGIAGAAIKAALYRERLEALLEETQRQAEELQTQQEELRVSNEELEQQAKSLGESQAKLEEQQAELEQTNRHLEAQTHSLTQQAQDLEETKLELQKKAEDLSRASQYKSEFLANMSHELRTPLNSSLIMAKLLSDNAEGNLTEEQIQFAQTIWTAGNDLLTLINDILDLSKVESGKLEIVPEIVNPQAICSKMSRIFSPMTKDKGLRFQVELDSNAPASFETDPHRLEQILQNLLSNALKFTQQGEISLHVRGVETGIEFAVRDTGVGIPEDKQDIIFEAFRQADGTTNRKFGGTGLGLSISRELARLLGGEIGVASKPGQGSTFSVTLPLRSVTPSVAPKKPSPQARPSAPVRRIPSPEKSGDAEEPLLTPKIPDDRENLDEMHRTLLVIEDDLAFAKILMNLARERGFKCLFAEIADEGCRLAQKYEPDGVLLDIKLPDHTGLSVLDRLKQSPKTRHIPVHVVSAQDHSRVALEMGATGHLLKPAQQTQLRQMLDQIESKITQKVRRLLVVEDDATQRAAIQKLIGNGDVKTEAAGSGIEALEKLKIQSFDCMIIDLTLPDMSGYELLEKMSQETEVSHPPVIVYTGRALSREEENRLHKYSRSIIIKGAKSPERLLSEVTLFLHKVESQLPADRQKMLHELRSREKTFDDRKIMVVDDDVRNIFALGSALEKKGAKVEIARSGKEALAKLDADPAIDLVLMDIMMPEMDGLAATREIRKQERFKTLPIIAVTAKAMRDDRQNCIEAGANDYLSKPIDIEKLLSLIRVWLPV